MVQTMLYYMQLGGMIFFVLFLILFVSYLMGKTLQAGIRRLWFRHLYNGKEFFGLITSSLIVGGALGAYFLIMGFVIARIGYATPTEVIVRNTQWIMQSENAVFGTWLPLWFQSSGNVAKPFFDMLGPLLVLAYTSLVFVMGSFLVIFLATSSRRCYEMILAFCISIIISLPFWYGFPVLRPLDMYVDNITDTVLSSEIRVMTENYAPNANLAAFLDRVRAFRSPRHFDLTNFPSMHVAWGIMLMYFAMEISLWWGVVMVPYALLNTVSTVYTLEHYGLDALAGAVVILLAIFLAKKIAKRCVPPQFEVIRQSLQSDMRTIRAGFL